MTIRNCLLFGIVCSAACASAGSRSADSSEVRSSVSRILDEHGAAAVRQDVGAAAAMFASDARMMVPGMDDVVGRENIAAVMRQVWPVVRAIEVKFSTQEVYVFGDTAVSVGTYNFVLEQEGQGRVQDRGRFMLLWKREEAGWKVFRDITNSSLAASIPQD